MLSHLISPYWWRIYRLLRRAKPIIKIQYQRLINDGWDQAACFAYLKKAMSLPDAQQTFQEVHIVGSSTYTTMLKASHYSAKAKLGLMVNRHLQASLDQDHFLQITFANYQWAPILNPRSAFFPYVRDLVVEAYSSPRGLKVDYLGEELHLFRSYLDRAVANLFLKFRFIFKR